MKRKQSPRVWSYKPQTAKFSAAEKIKLLAMVKETIEKLPKLSQKVSRLDIRANRVYLYELVKQFKPVEAMFTQPLIDDKYLEFPYARIPLLDTRGDKCTTDWQRHNNQWVTLYTGTMMECIESVENDNGWFRG
jgi:hypothetical protein